MKREYWRIPGSPEREQFNAVLFQNELKNLSYRLSLTRRPALQFCITVKIENQK
jgi:hypothetical protein